MRTLLIVLAVTVMATSMFGCNATAQHSVGQNFKYLHDDTQRVLGLDKPSGLHPRDLIASDSSEPYRGYP